MTMYKPKMLASVITQMNYGDLLQVATDLFEMNAGDNKGLRDMESAYGMAGTLWDWAESVMEDVELRENESAARWKVPKTDPKEEAA